MRLVPHDCATPSACTPEMTPLISGAEVASTVGTRTGLPTRSVKLTTCPLVAKNHRFGRMLVVVLPVNTPVKLCSVSVLVGVIVPSTQAALPPELSRTWKPSCTVLGADPLVIAR